MNGPGDVNADEPWLGPVKTEAPDAQDGGGPPGAGRGEGTDVEEMMGVGPDGEGVGTTTGPLAEADEGALALGLRGGACTAEKVWLPAVVVPQDFLALGLATVMVSIAQRMSPT